MPFGRSDYGLIVESHEGRPTKIEGNPSHPSTLGASSSRVQASVLGLYDPDRSQTVRLKGRGEVLDRFRDGLGGVVQGSCRGWWRRPRGPLRVLLSPTLARLTTEFRARYPKATWATYEAVSDENRLAGLRSASGRDLDLMLRFDQASVILALDADPLLTDPEMIRHARGFAAGRRAGASGGVMNRLYVVEGVFSLTGAHGGSSAPSREPADRAFLAALAARDLRAERRARQPPSPGADARWIDALAKDLLARTAARA